MFAIRAATSRDIPHLYDTDVKCYDNPWEEGTWLSRLYNSVVTVGTYRGEPIGFSCGTEGEHLVKVDKIAVEAVHRHLKLASKLVMPIVRLAVDKDKDLFMVMPETHLPDGALWAKSMGFKPAQPPLLPSYFTTCGEPVDGIAFTYTLSKRNASS